MTNLITFFISLLIATFFVPIFRIEIVCGMLAIVIFFCILNKTNILNDWSFRLLILFILLQFFWAILGFGITSYNSLLMTSLYFVAGVSICGCLDNFSKKQIVFLTVFMIAIFLLSCISTFTTLLIDPTILRKFAYDRTSSGISPYDLIYSYGVGEGLAILLPAFLGFGLLSTKKIFFISSIVVVVLGIITQFMASLATSAMLSLVFCILTLFSFFSEIKRLGVFRIVPILLFACIAVFLILPNLHFMDNLVFMSKMEDVQTSISGEGSVGQVGSRAELYKQSFSVCLHNPILGLGKTPEAFGVYDSETVGMHTALLDYYGMYGLFSLLLLVAWKQTIQKSLCLLNKSGQKRYQWCLYSLLFLLLLKGPVTIYINFFFSTVLVGLLIRCEVLENTRKRKYVS